MATSIALMTEPPQMWTLGWVADYPGRNDFLGVLLQTGASNNYGAVELGGVRRGDRRSRGSDRSRGRVGGLRPGGSDRSGRGPGRPARSTPRAGRCREPSCSGRRRTGWGSSGWPASRGPSELANGAGPARPGRARHRPPSYSLSAGTGNPVPAAATRLGGLRDPDRCIHLRDRHHVQPARHDRSAAPASRVAPRDRQDPSANR